MAQVSVATKTYASRVASFTNPTAKLILETMERKRTNLCVSVDVTKKADLLKVVEAVASDVCMVKTHIDIVEDFDADLTDKLRTLSKDHDFVIFEDRKFADIGNTVSLQYSSGVHKIASWSHLTNAHLVPGPGIITGLAEVGQPLGRGLLLLAEMSSKGNLAGGEYGQKCVQAARDDSTGFTCGFIAMDRIDEKVPLAAGQEERDFLVLTPGVGLDVKGDAKGQQYRTPDEVVRKCGCDVIIVGRGIYSPLLKEGSTAEALQSVKEQAARYRKAGWGAYLQRTQQNPESKNMIKRLASPLATPPRKRRLFAPAPPSSTVVSDGDGGPLASLLGQDHNVGSSDLVARRGYSLRRRTRPGLEVKVEEGTTTQEMEALTVASSRINGATMTPRKGSGKEVSSLKQEEGEEEERKPRQMKKEKASPFDVSPQKKTGKPIKLELDPSEVKAAPKRWRAQLDVLQKQRKRIVAPVDEMGCEENGREDRRADAWRVDVEDEEQRAKRDRLTILISLMLSSQTKDEVTAQAVKNLQTSLVDGISLPSILASTDEQISTCISKVGFWRRKTGYIKSAAVILRDSFGGDVPKDINELCSLPGVGPKMAFLTLQSAWKLNLGIGVDVHVHRLANRLGWCKTNDPEGTRLVLQSFLPKELHHSINKILVGFGQVVCVPVGPRCDLCDLGKARLCPSYRKVDPKSAATRKQVVLLPEEEKEGGQKEEQSHLVEDARPAVEVALEGAEAVGEIQVKREE